MSFLFSMMRHHFNSTNSINSTTSNISCEGILTSLFITPRIKSCKAVLNVLGISEEKSIKAILRNGFNKKKNFTRFVKRQLSTTKNGKINVEILKGQESFRIKSFVKSNIWVLLPAGKSKFKKGDIVDCFFPNLSNQNLV